LYTFSATQEGESSKERKRGTVAKPLLEMLSVSRLPLKGRALYFLFRKAQSTFFKETCRGSHGVGRWFVEPHGFIDEKAFRAMICLRGFCVLGTKREKDQMIIVAISTSQRSNDLPNKVFCTLWK